MFAEHATDFGNNWAKFLNFLFSFVFSLFLIHLVVSALSRWPIRSSPHPDTNDSER